MEENGYYKVSRAVMKVNKGVFAIEKFFLVVIMYGLLGVLFINVLFRFVLFIPSPWADELARYTFTWLVLLGSSAAMYRWEHIDINLIDTIVAKFIKDDEEKYNRVMAVIKKFALAVSVAFLVYLIVVYGQYLQMVMKLGTKSMFLGCGLVVPMSAIYVCSALMVFHGLCYLIIPEKIRSQEG